MPTNKINKNVNSTIGTNWFFSSYIFWNGGKPPKVENEKTKEM